MRCEQAKPEDEFYADARKLNGLQSACRTCVRAEMRWRRANGRVGPRRQADPEARRRYDLDRCYGITPEDYDRMFGEQGGVCAICHQAEKTVRCGKVQRLSVDHDHGTGRVRGLLCNACNRAIGKMADDVERLRSAVAYLGG